MRDAWIGLLCCLWAWVFWFWCCWMLWVLQLLHVPKQPSSLVPKPVTDRAALGTASERKLLLCGKERSTGRIIVRPFLGCELKLSPSSLLEMSCVIALVLPTHRLWKPDMESLVSVWPESCVTLVITVFAGSHHTFKFGCGGSSLPPPPLQPPAL